MDLSISYEIECPKCSGVGCYAPDSINGVLDVALTCWVCSGTGRVDVVLLRKQRDAAIDLIADVAVILDTDTDLAEWAFAPIESAGEIIRELAQKTVRERDEALNWQSKTITDRDRVAQHMMRRAEEERDEARADANRLAGALLDRNADAEEHNRVAVSLAAVNAKLDAEVERLRTAMEKISAIRDSIVGKQGFNFSEHAYPLVAVLDEAGFSGAGYEIARQNLGTLIEQITTAEAEIDRLRTGIREIQRIAAPGRAWPYDRCEALLGNT